MLVYTSNKHLSVMVKIWYNMRDYVFLTSVPESTRKMEVRPQRLSHLSVRRCIRIQQQPHKHCKVTNIKCCVSFQHVGSLKIPRIKYRPVMAKISSLTARHSDISFALQSIWTLFVMDTRRHYISAFEHLSYAVRKMPSELKLMHNVRMK
jgi:hypothetical protein